MIRNRSINVVSSLMIVAMLAGALGVGGCAKTQERHADWVSAADQRWKQMRSGLLLNVAQQRFETGDLDEAEKTLLEAMQMDAENPALHLLAGRIALERGKLERAHQRITKAVELDAELPVAHYFLGIVQQRWNRHEDALESYERAYNLQPDNLNYLLATAETYVALDRSDEALGLLKSRIDYFGDSAGARAAIGQIHAMRNEYDQAVPYLRQAVAMAPEDLTLQEDLAKAQFASGQTTEALRALAALVERPELAERTDLFLALGRCYEKTQQWSKAEKVYQEVSRQDPDDGEVWIRLTECAMAQNKLDNAAVAAHRAIRAMPQRAEGYLLLGLIWQQRDQPQRAAAFFDQASKVAPDNASPRILHGLTMEKLGKRESAAESYRQALEITPDDERVKRLFANASSPSGDE